MRHSLLIVFSFFVFLAPAPAQNELADAGLSGDGIEHLEKWFERTIARGELPMADVLIYRNGVVGYHEQFGTGNQKSGEPLEEDQIFHLMSMTKPIVSVAFMMLYEEGHFQLGDSVARYLPEFSGLRVAAATDRGVEVPTQPVERPVTIEMLLNHTAGFSHGLGATQLDREIAQRLYYRPQADIAARVGTLVELPLIGQPGKQWYYSAAPDVLARLVEHFSGMSVARFLRLRIFEPLGMDDTGYNVAPSEHERVVKNHQVAQDTILELAGFQLPKTGNRVFGGTHGLYSTTNDYLRFCRMLLNGGTLDGRRFLGSKTVELMTMNHVGELRGGGFGFGLGFGVVTDVSATGLPSSEGTYYWSGAYCTYFLIDPKEDMIAIVMSQRSPYSGRHERSIWQMVYQCIE